MLYNFCNTAKVRRHKTAFDILQIYANIKHESTKHSIKVVLFNLPPARRMIMAKRRVVVLCTNDGSCCPACPEIHTDDTADTSKQISITDDFGNTSQMSKDQFRLLITKAKAGEFDNI